MRYKLFGSNTGLMASELIFGAASLGSRRGYGTSPEDAKQILTSYANAGGNFIDVADQYQLGEAEELVGDFMRGKRNDFIICSKYTRSSEANPSPANSGNHRKAMVQAVEGSLKRLKTEFIDIYMPHFDDGLTPIDEIVRGLEDLVRSGKVVYAGLANFPAWKAAAMAVSTTLAALQIEYNLLQRTPDRDFLPMAAHFGLGLMLYSPLAGGVLTGKYRQGESGRITLGNRAYEEDAITKSVIDQLESIAAVHEVTVGQVALAWVRSRNAFPIIGARTLGHLQDAIKATDIRLSEDQLQLLDQLTTVPLGYPAQILATVQKPATYVV